MSATSTLGLLGLSYQAVIATLALCGIVTAVCVWAVCVALHDSGKRIDAARPTLSPRPLDYEPHAVSDGALYRMACDRCAYWTPEVDSRVDAAMILAAHDQAEHQ